MVDSIHTGQGVTIAQSDGIITITFLSKPNRFVQDKLRSEANFCRRNGTEAKKWYASYSDDRWRKIHQLLCKEVSCDTP